MPDSVDHRVAMHELVTKRRKEGKPSWDRTIHVGDIFYNEDLNTLQKGEQIAIRFETSVWFTARENGELKLGQHEPIRDLVEELKDGIRDDSDFNVVWNAIYDECDYFRVWINTLEVK